MSMDKKLAARQAAAKYSTNPAAAFVEYGKLTGQIDPSFSFDEPNREYWEVVGKLNQEMLELLPQYRHPANDEFAETMIFIDPNSIQLEAKMHQEPEFLRLLKKEDIPADIIKKTKEYVKESEVAKLDLCECKREIEELKKMFEKVRSIYNDNRSERSDKRNKLVVQALGLSTGRRPKQVNKKKVYIDYLRLVRKEGMPRSNAVNKVQELHNIQSYDATLKTLYEYRATHIRKWEELNPGFLKKWLKDFIPGRPKDRG